MSTDGKIYIYITDERTGEVIKDTKVSVPQKSKKDEKELLSDYVKHQFFNFIKNEATQMAQYTIGNIGNFTGDYNSQRQVNYSISALNILAGIAGGAMTGLKYTGSPYGALAGAGIAVASQGVNFGLQLFSQNVEIRKQNYNINQLRQLSGLDTLTNGSRI